MPPLLLLLRLDAYLRPLLLLAIAAYGSVLVFLELITFRGTTDIFQPERLSKRIFAKSWLQMNTMIKKWEEEGPLPALAGKAYGTVVEIGPGTGNQLSRYDKSKVHKVFGIEPNAELHPLLRKTIKEVGLEDIYTIVPYGVEDFDQLKRYGVEAGTADTVMSVSVLCSVPRPEDMAKATYKLLKPGGQMLVHEHVASSDPISRVVQMIYDIVWPHALGGCTLQRHTGQYISLAGKWQEIDLEPAKVEDSATILPKVIGRYVKSFTPDS